MRPTMAEARKNSLSTWLQNIYRSHKMNPLLIAPCGMNCGICLAYLRDKNKCPGCRSKLNKLKSKSCARCVIARCPKLKKCGYKYCFSCGIMPCARLKHLDKRYRTNYGMSMLDNLAYIKRSGIKSFVKKEIKRWACKKCGGTVCVHRGYCFACGKRSKHYLLLKRLG